MTTTLNSAGKPVPIKTTEWQDISTAPKDGTHVLLWAAPNNFVDIGFFRQKEDHGDFWTGDCWQSWFHKDRARPTHWMPLPDPPE